MKTIWGISLVIAGFTFCAQNLRAEETKPTFVLVHGALFTKAGWKPLEDELTKRKESVVSLDLPGRNNDGVDPKTITLDLAAQSVCKVVDQQKDKVILVGHSQGGAVITEALSHCGEKVAGLIFIAAVVPYDGDIAFKALNEKRDVNFAKVASLGGDENLPPNQREFLITKDLDTREKYFFADLRERNPALADAAREGMVNEPSGIGLTPSNFPKVLFAALPKFYISTKKDQIISYETQLEIQKSIRVNNGIKKNDFVLDTSHVPFLAFPELVADKLEAAAKAISEKPVKYTDELKIAENYISALKGQADLNNILADDIEWIQGGHSKLSGIYHNKAEVFGLFGKFLGLSNKTLKIDTVFDLVQVANHVQLNLQFSAKSKIDSITLRGVDLLKMEKDKIKQAMILTIESDSAREDQFWDEAAKN